MRDALREPLVARSQDPAVKNRLMELTQSAVDRGAFGSPTFFVNDEMFFGKDQLPSMRNRCTPTWGPGRRRLLTRRAKGGSLDSENDPDPDVRRPRWGPPDRRLADQIVR